MNRLIGLAAFFLTYPIFADPFEEALDCWDTIKARNLLPTYEQAKGRDLARWGVIFLLEGEYEKAVDAFVRGGPFHYPGLINLAKAGADHIRGYIKVQSADGKIVFAHAPGADEMTVPYALEAAMHSMREIEKWLGLAPRPPIRIEMARDFRTFSALTGIREEILRTSGTTAICTHRKIVLLSPSLFPYGYPFADAIAHEMVHFFLVSAGGQNLPIWLQEGIAKYLEGIWRGQEPGSIGYAGKHLLSKALLQGRLWPIETLTMAFTNFGSPWEATLAYAEVCSFVDFLVRRFGRQVLTAIVEKSRMRAVDPVRDVTGVSLKILSADWARELTSTLAVENEGQRTIYLLEPEETLLGSLPEDVATSTRIGDLLRTSGKTEAALQYYRSARDALASPHPLVVARLAACLNDLGKSEEALVEIEKARIPDDAFPLIARERGRALFLNKRYKEALYPLLYFVRTNPYDPVAHECLSQVWDGLGQPSLAEQEKRLARYWR